jgi:hypothetical protein
MGQEASVNRNGDPDEAPTNHPTPASPQRGGAWRTTAFEDKTGADFNAATAAAAERSANGVGQRNRPPGEIPYQQPQSPKQLQLQHHAAGESAGPPPRHTRSASPPPPRQHQQQMEQPSSSSTSMMSRAVLSSMFQRAVSSGGIGGGSGHGSRKAVKGSGQQQQQQQRQHQQQQQQQQKQKIEPTSINGNNHSAHSPARSDSVRHKDLSPESKARQHAMMMKNQEQQQQQQQRQTKPMSTQQFLSLDTISAEDGHQFVTSSANSIFTSNGTGVDNDVGVAASSMVQGMTNLHLSPHRPSSSHYSPPQTPPSPRALLLKKMQNNDEEDWEKAWVEDSEDSDEDGDSTPKRSNNNIAFPTIAWVAPTAPYLERDSAVSGGAMGATEGGALPILPHQLLEVGGSLQDVAAPASIWSAHSAFMPTKLAPQEQPHDHRHQQHQHQQANDVSLLPGMLKTPIIQYPPIRPESDFFSPKHTLNQREVEEDANLLRVANDALQAEEVGEDGRRYNWNSYTREDIVEDRGEEAEDEGPCASMFEPALRVLGRGSFGRVSLFSPRQVDFGTITTMMFRRETRVGSRHTY